MKGEIWYGSYSRRAKNPDAFHQFGLTYPHHIYKEPFKLISNSLNFYSSNYLKNKNNFILFYSCIFQYVYFVHIVKKNRGRDT